MPHLINQGGKIILNTFGALVTTDYAIKMYYKIKHDGYEKDAQFDSLFKETSINKFQTKQFREYLTKDSIS